MNTKRMRSAALIALASALFVGMGTAPAVANDTPEDRAEGLWYADRLNFDDIRAQGLTGKGIKIAVIDSGINTRVPELQGANITVKSGYCGWPDSGEIVQVDSDDPEDASHGTSITALLVGNGVAADGGPGTRGIVPDAEIWFYGALDGTETGREDRCENLNPATGEYAIHSDKTDRALDHMSPGAYAALSAIQEGADIISVSLITSDASGWFIAQKAAMKAGVPIVAGTPNPDGSAIDNVLGGMFYPYSNNGVASVGGVDNDGNVMNGGGDEANFQGDAEGARNLMVASAGTSLLTPGNSDRWGPTIGFGTSLATPLTAGTIALGMEKYPEATAFQVMQALVHTTGQGRERDEPEWAGPQYGYGITNPTAMLAKDPTQYPDRNPVFVYDVENDPRCEYPEGTTNFDPFDCAWAAAPNAADIRSGTPADSRAQSEARLGKSNVIKLEGGILPVILAFVVLPLTLLSMIALTWILVPRARQRQRALDAQWTRWTGWYGVSPK